MINYARCIKSTGVSTVLILTRGEFVCSKACHLTGIGVEFHGGAVEDFGWGLTRAAQRFRQVEFPDSIIERPGWDRRGWGGV